MCLVFNHRIHNTKTKDKPAKLSTSVRVPKEIKCRKKTEKTKSKRNSLNPYQKFVKNESKKEKYNKMPGKKRLSIIASEWNRINK